MGEPLFDGEFKIRHALGGGILMGIFVYGAILFITLVLAPLVGN